MRNNNKWHIKLHLPAIVSAFAKHPYIILITVILPIMIAIYHLGSDNMAAKKDREYMDRTVDLVQHHQEELSTKQKECDEWREKYLLLLNRQSHPSNNSP